MKHLLHVFVLLERVDHLEHFGGFVFGQLDRERIEQQGGGLGLAIASRYATINKGRIEFERRAGGGSIVSLVLPILK